MQFKRKPVLFFQVTHHAPTRDTLFEAFGGMCIACTKCGDSFFIDKKSPLGHVRGIVHRFVYVEEDYDASSMPCNSALSKESRIYLHSFNTFLNQARLQYV
jgi:hypothetical protein